MWRQFHGCPGSGVGTELVFITTAKQYDTLKKNTTDKTLENTLKTGMNTKFATCDDKGVFTDDEDTYMKRKYPTVGRRLVGDRVKRRWLSYGLSQ
jgi:hypothetical protein